MPKRKYANSSRIHLGEDALQAYLRRRLLEILPELADGVEVQILREDQIAYRERNDLRVTAPCHGTRQLATVVIEVKWSMNPDTRTALTTQLGERYLRGEQLTHGIYVVGWSGKWRRGDRSRNNTDVQRLLEFLAAQRNAYCQAGAPGSGLQIEPIILDLQWHRHPAPTPRSNAS